MFNALSTCLNDLINLTRPSVFSLISSYIFVFLKLKLKSFFSFRYILACTLVLYFILFKSFFTDLYVQSYKNNETNVQTYFHGKLMNTVSGPYRMRVSIYQSWNYTATICVVDFVKLMFFFSRCYFFLGSKSFNDPTL